MLAVFSDSITIPAHWQRFEVYFGLIGFECSKRRGCGRKKVVAHYQLKKKKDNRATSRKGARLSEGFPVPLEMGVGKVPSRANISIISQNAYLCKSLQAATDLENVRKSGYGLIFRAFGPS